MLKKIRDSQNIMFLFWRLVTYAVVAFLTLLLNFILPRLMPGNPADQMIQQFIQKTGQQPSAFLIEQIYARYGNPHENVFYAFFKYLNSMLHGDFGISIQYYPVNVIELISRAIPWTVYLAIVSTIIGWIIGTIAGAKIGWKPGGKLDSIVTPITMFFSSIPAFWLGLLIVWWLGYQNDIFPSAGSYDTSITNVSLLNPDFLLSVLLYSILPLATLILVGFSQWLFSMRNMMVTTVTEDYIHLARAKGLPEKTVRNKYAIRNAILPNFTGLAQSLGGSLVAVILAESVFLYPGVGGLLTAAQANRDYPVMQGVVLIIVFLTLIMNFIADSLYVFLDPRTREK
jgi:peptide/nickel transport system permease protein